MAKTQSAARMRALPVSEPRSTRKGLAAAYRLSTALILVTLFASAAGFFITDLFKRDNPALAGCARGTALVILAAAVPVLAASMLLSSRGWVRARLIWAGMLAYILYNSVYFTFSATFNRFFLVFVAALGLAFWSLLALLKNLDVEEIRTAFPNKTPVRVTAVALALPILIFLLTDLAQSAAATAADTLPATIVGTQMPTNHFHVVDLAILVPAFGLAIYWLWQRRAWGYALAGMLLSYYAVELLGIASDQWFGGMAAPQSPLADASVAPAFLIGALVYLAALVNFMRRR